MSSTFGTYVADQIRAAIDLTSTEQTLRLLELAVMVERMERALDERVAEAHDDALSLDGLISRCNAT